MSGLEIPKYSMTIEWSPEDGVYVVTIPELPGSRTHGETYEIAARNGREVIEMVVEGLVEDGQPIPSARSFERAKPVALPKPNEKHTVRRVS